MIEIRCDKCKKEIKFSDVNLREELSPKGIGTQQCLLVYFESRVYKIENKILCEECYKKLEAMKLEIEKKFLEENEK